MFRVIISPILRSTRLCVTACGIMHPRCCRPAASSVHYSTSCNTQSSATEDGRNYRPKHVELIGIINKPLLLHLVGCLYYCKLQIDNQHRIWLKEEVKELPINCLTSTKTVRSVETSGTAQSNTRHHIPEEMRLQEHRWENLIPRYYLLSKRSFVRYCHNLGSCKH